MISVPYLSHMTNGRIIWCGPVREMHAINRHYEFTMATYVLLVHVVRIYLAIPRVVRFAVASEVTMSRVVCQWTRGQRHGNL